MTRSLGQCVEHAKHRAATIGDLLDRYISNRESVEPPGRDQARSSEPAAETPIAGLNALRESGVLEELGLHKKSREVKP